MKHEKINVKNKIINHLILNGKKETSEKLLLNTVKELQKNLLKQSKKLINLAIVLSIPVFKVHKILKKTNKKRIREVPVIISSKKTRISLSIKFILSVLKKKNLKYFYIKFYQEIILNIKNESPAILIRNKIQKDALLKKHFFYYYRW